ncbi:MAG: hypothetical protein NC411_00200 [Bacteroides sp.]|nr:hypothetical protein [Bacteroides sp.]
MKGDIHNLSDIGIDDFLRQELIKIIIRENGTDHLREFRMLQQERDRIENRSKKIERLSMVAIILSTSVLLIEAGRFAIWLMSH